MPSPFALLAGNRLPAKEQWIIDNYRAAFGIDERQHEQLKPGIFPHHHTGRYRDQWKTPGIPTRYRQSTGGALRGLSAAVRD